MKSKAEGTPVGDTIRPEAGEVVVLRRNSGAVVTMPNNGKPLLFTSIRVKTQDRLCRRDT
jgi:hypothetical protein